MGRISGEARSFPVDVPQGITRSVVLEMCRSENIPFQVCEYSLAEVYRADEMFCIGTMRELALVRQVDGRMLGEGCEKPIFDRLTSKFREITAAEGIPVCGDL